VSVVSSRAATELTYLSYFHQDSKYSGSRGDVVLERQCCAAHAVHTDPGHRSRPDCPKRACPSPGDDFLSRSLSTFWPYQNNLIKSGPKDILINFWSFCIFVTFHHFVWWFAAPTCPLSGLARRALWPWEPLLSGGSFGTRSLCSEGQGFLPTWPCLKYGYSRIAPKWHFEWGKWMKINETGIAV